MRPLPLPFNQYLDVFHVANISIYPLERNASREDIECPGDTIPYNCSIYSNNETLHLTWRVVLPDGLSLNLTYDNTTTANVPYSLNEFISSTLTQFQSDEYIESTLSLTVLADTLLNQTKLECIIENLIDTVYVEVNTSGISNPIESNNVTYHYFSTIYPYGIQHYGRISPGNGHNSRL